jgi:hypothetical protein
MPVRPTYGRCAKAITLLSATSRARSTGRVSAVSQRPSGHARVQNDFYAEPPECTVSLINAYTWSREGFHDPFVGSATRSQRPSYLASPRPVPT